MAAFVPSRRDAEVNAAALAKVREDKLRESGDGFDGTWVAHPDLVPVATEVFDAALGDRLNQKERQRDDVRASAAPLLDLYVPGGQVTEAGVRNNVNVALQYLEAWLRGAGAVAIHNLMEDTATAEISRAQLWQWIRHAVALSDGRRMDAALYARTRDEEVAALRAAGQGAGARLDDAVALLDELVLGEEFAEFLTIPGYRYLLQRGERRARHD
jgi:malate synthase